MEGIRPKTYRNSSNAPEVVPERHLLDMEIDYQKTQPQFNVGLAPYPLAQNVQVENFQSPLAAHSWTGRRICGFSVTVFCAIVAFVTFVVGGLVGGGIGGAIASKNNKSSSGTITTTVSISSTPSSTASSASSTTSSNAAGCNASNGTTYKSTAFPGSDFIVLCDIDIQATTDIGGGQQVFTLGSCFDLCARHNNASTDLHCVGAVWVIYSSSSPQDDSMCFLKATTAIQVGPNAQTLVGGLLL